MLITSMFATATATTARPFVVLTMMAFVMFRIPTLLRVLTLNIYNQSVLFVVCISRTAAIILLRRLIAIRTRRTTFVAILMLTVLTLFAVMFVGPASVFAVGGRVSIGIVSAMC